MEEGNVTLIVVGIIGFIQVSLATILGYLNNKSTAKKDRESVYAGLVDRLEKRLEAEHEASNKRIEALEEKCAAYEKMLEKFKENEALIKEHTHE